MNNKVNLKNMCDRCLRELGEGEKMFGFKLIDDNEYERPFKGHEHCVQEMIEIIQQLYGKREDCEDTSN